MTLKTFSAISAAILVLASCAGPVSRRSSTCLAALETSAGASTVQTVSGPVAGYIDDGVFIYKGIPYAKAERFAEPVSPKY